MVARRGKCDGCRICAMREECTNCDEHFCVARGAAVDRGATARLSKHCVRHRYACSCFIVIRQSPSSPNKIVAGGCSHAMPSSRSSTCFVPSCKSGYRSCVDKLSVFRAPKDASRREQWARNITQADEELTHDGVVCECHFDE